MGYRRDKIYLYNKTAVNIYRGMRNKNLVIVETYKMKLTTYVTMSMENILRLLFLSDEMQHSGINFRLQLEIAKLFAF